MARAMETEFGGAKVLVTGSPSLWFNLFASNPQVFGGHEPFNINWANRVAAFTIYTGMNVGDRDADICILWMKAFGAHAINVSGPESGDHYPAFTRSPRIFQGKLVEAMRDEHFTVYRVPEAGSSAAHVVPRDGVVDRPPVHGLDVGELRGYVAAIERKEARAVTWASGDRLRVSASFAPGQVLTVQRNWHPGWAAADAEGMLPIHRDGLGMMWLSPRRPGHWEIDLRFRPAWLSRACRGISLAVLAAMVASVVIRAWASRSARVGNH